MKRILIAGDIMLDTYIFGNVKRISPEAPVPVLLEDESRMRFVPGGAANVAVNVEAAGHCAALFSVTGTDENGSILIRRLEDEEVDISRVKRLSSRPTTSKLRYIGQSNQQILRVDREQAKDISYSDIEIEIDDLEANISAYDLILLSDYSKGFLSLEVCQKLIKMGEKHGIPVLVDVKDKQVDKYKGAFLLKPNRMELAGLTDCKTETIEQCIEASIKLCRSAESKFVLSTLGADGMVLVNESGLIKRVDTVAREVYDVTGAGDTSIAYLAVSLAGGMSIEAAVDRANVAAGIQVSKMGTSLVYPDEVDRAQRNEEEIQDKYLNFYSPNGLDLFLRNRAGKKVVFTNGCFDILHVGHITYLQKARKLGDILVVGINSDASVKRLKGNDRPVNGIDDRMRMLSALGFVDFVVPFEEDTPLDLIKTIQPDVLVKGGDYEIENIVGAEFVTESGGLVTTIPLVEGKSTTEIIKKAGGISRF